MEKIFILAAPFFGLIFLGFACGKLLKKPQEGMAWLHVFLVYLALPSLFFQLMAKTPFAELANGRFILTTTLATAFCFALSYGVGWFLRFKNAQEATICAVAGAYSNIGYMGPGLTLSALGSGAAVPVGLIFCFDNAFLFTMTPLLMALATKQHQSLPTLFFEAGQKVLFHPFILATLAGVTAAYFQFQPPEAIETMLNWLKNAAAPCALFALGVTVAQRTVKTVSADIPLLLFIKLIIHPLLVYLMLTWMGGFAPVYIYAAVLMAALPPALNVYILAQHYGVYVENASTLILIGTAASVVTVVCFLYFIQHGLM